MSAIDRNFGSLNSKAPAASRGRGLFSRRRATHGHFNKIVASGAFAAFWRAK
jgi:hypothetical protein